VVPVIYQISLVYLKHHEHSISAAFGTIMLLVSASVWGPISASCIALASIVLFLLFLFVDVNIIHSHIVINKYCTGMSKI